MKFMDKSAKVWMEMGLGNKQHCIDISKFYSTLGDDMACALAGFHALTGNYYNPEFHGKGKS